MRKLVCALLLIAAIMSVLTMTAFAATDAYEITFYKDFTAPYAELVSGSPVTIRYNPSNLFYGTRASTDISVSVDATGYAYVYIVAVNNEVAYSHNDVASGNIINSGKAIVAGQQYAKDVNHYANRTVNGTALEWEYWCH